jgi:hypothetical protein
MKKIKIFSILTLILIGVLGCAPGPVILRSEKGETVKCEPEKGPVDTCVKQYEVQGYKRVEPEIYAYPPMYRGGY